MPTTITRNQFASIVLSAMPVGWGFSSLTQHSGDFEVVLAASFAEDDVQMRVLWENGRLSLVEVDFAAEEVGEDLGEPVLASCDADDLASELSTLFAKFTARLDYDNEEGDEDEDEA